MLILLSNIMPHVINTAVATIFTRGFLYSVISMYPLGPKSDKMMAMASNAILNLFGKIEGRLDVKSEVNLKERLLNMDLIISHARPRLSALKITHKIFTQTNVMPTATT